MGKYTVIAVALGLIINLLQAHVFVWNLFVFNLQEHSVKLIPI